MGISFKHKSDFESVDIRDTFIDSEGRAHFVGFYEGSENTITLVNLVTGETSYFNSMSLVVTHLKDNNFKKRDFSLTIL